MDQILIAVANNMAFGHPVPPRIRSLINSPRVDKKYLAEEIKDTFNFGFRFQGNLPAQYSGAAGFTTFDEVPG